MNAPRTQRGIALLTAIILVALATVLAVAIAFNTAMTARRGASSFTVEQGLQFGAGAEALAAYALREDNRVRSQGGGGTPPPSRDFPGEVWNNAPQPIEIAPEVTLEAKLDDESGKFNLNTLVKADGTVDDDAVELLERLLEQLNMEKRWASLIADWIDSDPNVYKTGGEDDLYTRQKPGFRPPNTWITSASELMVMPEFGRDRYLKLLPHVTALPPQENKINVCFATGELLDAIESTFLQNSTQTYSRPGSKVLAQGRAGGCFPSPSLLWGTVVWDPTKANALKAKLVEQSTYFRLHTWVSIGTTRFALYSLLQRNVSEVKLVQRTFGTE